LTESEQNETETKSASKSSSSKTSSAAVSSVAKYPVERLLEDSYALTGYPSYIVAGALNGKSGEFSVDQVKSAVDKFLSAEVKEG